MRSLYRLLVPVALACSTFAGVVRAQATEPVPRPALIPIPYRTYIALDPLIIPFDAGSAEFESGIAQGMTMGGSVSYTAFDDRWTSADFKLRYYPGEVVLRGFSIGLTAGYLRYSTDNLPGNVRESLNTATAGVATDYNFMLGGSRRFIVGTGLGAKRILAGAEDRKRVDIGKAYVTARFVLGLAF